MPFGRKRYDDPDLPLDELMTRWPATVPVFMRHGMLCVGCPIGPFHTVVEACEEYGLDEEGFREELEIAITRAAG
jgi:hybrid cluster-associated redox disulfide protein